MNGDIPHAIPDSVAYEQRYSLPHGWISSASWYAWWFSYHLGYPITVDDALSIIGRLNGFGPHEREDTWDAVERSPDAFWRSQI